MASRERFSTSTPTRRRARRLSTIRSDLCSPTEVWSSTRGSERLRGFRRKAVVVRVEQGRKFGESLQGVLNRARIQSPARGTRVNVVPSEQVGLSRDRGVPVREFHVAVTQRVERERAVDLGN